VAGIVAAACLVAAGSALVLSATGGGAKATDQAAAGELKAFQRASTASDAIPRAALGPLPKRFGRVVASRRIATASGLRGHAALYLVRLKRHYTCLIQLDHGSAGGGCSPSREFLSGKRRVNAGAGNGFFNGVAGNEVARVAFVDRHWRLRPVRLTRDNGFLYACRNRNGCIDVIKAVNGYDRGGRLVSHQVWSR
jgi:hypothetical protein